MLFTWVDYSAPMYGDYVFPDYGTAIGWIIALVIVIPIPLGILIVCCCISKGSTVEVNFLFVSAFNIVNIYIMHDISTGRFKIAEKWYILHGQTTFAIYTQITNANFPRPQPPPPPPPPPFPLKARILICSHILDTAS